MRHKLFLQYFVVALISFIVTSDNRVFPDFCFAGMLLVGLLLVCSAQAASLTDKQINSRAPSDSEVLFGKRLYLEGLQSDGLPIQAVVANDVTVDGRMFSCVNCHQRSGLGSVEGSVVAWPINGVALFDTRRRTGAWNPAPVQQRAGARERNSLPSGYQAEIARVAYTEETLARAIRTGVAADGRLLSPVMPRYTMGDVDMRSLVDYLRNLSSVDDPGVDDQQIRFATVISEGVSAEDRDAMLLILQAHVDAHNTQVRPHVRRAKQSPFYKSEHFGSYRKLTLDVWTLAGDEESWGEQLNDYYAQQPVFALLGGIAAGSWSPIHKFAEEHEIPSIFPITDQPVVSDSDWYTLYFSKGHYQEGDTVARFLHSSDELAKNSRIIQIYRSGSAGSRIARGFSATWSGYGHRKVEDLVLSSDSDLTWPEDPDDLSQAVVLIWLDAVDTETLLTQEPINAVPPAALFASFSLLNGNVNVISDELRDRVLLTHAGSLPTDNKYRLLALKNWLRIKDIPQLDIDIQSRMFFLGWMLPGVLRKMRGEFQREYFMESFDMMTDQDSAIAAFPRLSFGPGQRYASKGCYIVQIDKGDNPELQAVSSWVVN